MLSKAHLTSHSRMFGSRWVITPSRLSGSWRSFLYSSVYSCHLYLISSASARFIPFLSFIGPIFAWMLPWYLRFSWTHLYSFPFCCFPLFLCIDSWAKLSYLSLLFFGTLHSNGNIFPFLLCFVHLFFSQLFIRPLQTVIFLFCISFPWWWSWSLSPVLTHIYGVYKDDIDNPVYETAKETQMYRTVFWTLWERAKVGWFGRMELKHVYYLMWNESPV